MDELIDETITITIDDLVWVESAKNASLLIIHTIFRPLHSDKPLKSDDLLSLRKQAVKGQIAKRKTYMGWDIQNRSLWLFLLREKRGSLGTGYQSIPSFNKNKYIQARILYWQS